MSAGPNEADREEREYPRETRIYNKHLVGQRGDEIVILKPPVNPMTPEDAVFLAVWLVACTKTTGEQFASLLNEVRGVKRYAILKSGGPLMAIDSITQGKAVCSWNDDSGKLCRESFPLSSLYRCLPIEAIQ